MQCVEIALEISSGTSNVQSKRTATCDLGRGTILDIAYLSDDLALVLWMEDGMCNMFLVYCGNI